MEWLKILMARIKCNSFCMWRLIRYLDSVCELNCWDKKEKLSVVAAVRGNLLNKDHTLNNNLEIVKIFYDKDGVFHETK